MRYFQLIDDMSPRMRRRWHIGTVLLPDGTEPRLRKGIRLMDSRSLKAEVHHIGYILEFCTTSFAVPIATNELAHAIEAIVGQDIQCLPLTISGQTGMVILNALRVIRCVHEERSEFEKFTIDDPVRPDLAGQYSHIYKLVLGKNAIPPDAHFFRVKDWEVCLIVSETVKDAMERVGCYGAEFTELEMA
jgi:hypothetical protein